MRQNHDGPRLFDGDYIPNTHARNTAGAYHLYGLATLEEWQYGGADKYRALLAKLADDDRIRAEEIEYLGDAETYHFRRRFRRYTRKERGNLSRARARDRAGKTDLSKYPRGLYYHVLKAVSSY